MFADISNMKMKFHTSEDERSFVLVRPKHGLLWTRRRVGNSLHKVLGNPESAQLVNSDEKFQSFKDSKQTNWDE